MNPPLPAGLVVRPPAREDASALVAMLNRYALAAYGREIFSEPRLHIQWGEPGFDLATDAWIVQASDGQIAGYGYLWRWVMADAEMRIGALLFVHPEYEGRGIGTALLQLAEARAHQLFSEAAPDARVYVMQVIGSNNTAARQLLEYHGYTETRHDWEMEITFTNSPPAPAWPEGITVRTFVPGQDEQPTYTAQQESFQDHRGFQPTQFDHWAQHRLQRENFDPSLWFLAMDGTEIAGISLCYAEPDSGLVGQLGVRRPWRRQGLGLALLQHSFGEFYRRGIHKVELGVDAQSLTGATRLYERAGMQVVVRLDRYEKELRPGKAAGTQAGEE